MENSIITVLDVIKQMTILVPSIIASSMILTGLINAAFNVQKNNAKHVISWIVAVVGALFTCVCGQMTFGLGNWDYLISVMVGLLAGGASNGIYDWPMISDIIDKFYILFGNKKV